MAPAEDHLRELLKLPLEGRAYAAKRLLDSLDGDEREDLDIEEANEVARAAELTRRAQSVIDGTAELIDAAEVQRRVTARLHAVRAK
ncbi:MAG TPA: hypothetical protein VH165_14855 [Kofleriaceae bacterium]|jgi:hypothetical protein|nr:hypothetical protein [Kofleriaceae bacterium]